MESAIEILRFPGDEGSIFWDAANDRFFESKEGDRDYEIGRPFVQATVLFYQDELWDFQKENVRESGLVLDPTIRIETGSTYIEETDGFAYWTEVHCKRNTESPFRFEGEGHASEAAEFLSWIVEDYRDRPVPQAAMNFIRQCKDPSKKIKIDWHGWDSPEQYIIYYDSGELGSVTQFAVFNQLAIAV
jgi:hypothetical protein